MTRSAVSAVALAVLLGAGAGLPAHAEVLILTGGKKIQTEGPWVLKGDLLTVHEVSGKTTTVSTSIVDSAACKRINGDNLRITTIPVADGVTPMSGRQIWPVRSNAPPPTANRAIPVPGGAGGAVPSAANSAAAAPHATAATGSAASQDPKARTLTSQQRLRREAAYQRIVAGCTQMFVLDRDGFQHCVDTQMAVLDHGTPPTQPSQHP
jgi:hypothetical protein